MNEEVLTLLIQRYISETETAETATICRCIWQDVPAPGGGTRKVIKDVTPDCPVHTKEGVIVGFLAFMKETQGMVLTYVQ